jgi:hypothetical protein
VKIISERGRPLGVVKYQVFISSTYEDLKEERDQVIRAVLEMGHIPVGMEMFSAADEEQWQIIAKHIDESDYFAVMAAHRIGSMAGDGVSYTRKEYEYALSKGIPVLGFVIDDKAHWPADRVDTTTGAKKALTDFKNLIREKPVSFWSNAEDLYGRFTVALVKAITAKPREGWVRASNIGGGPEVMAEVIRLSAENATLRQQLTEAKEASQKEQREEITRTVETLFATERKPSYRYAGSIEWHDDAKISLFRVFQKLGPEMIIEASTASLANSLAMEMRTDTDRQWDIVAVNQVRGLLADLLALDLVQPSTRKHAVSDKDEYWSLSAYGNDVLKRIHKVFLTDPDDAEPEEPEDDGPSGQGGEPGGELVDTTTAEGA